MVGQVDHILPSHVAVSGKNIDDEVMSCHLQ